MIYVVYTVTFRKHLHWTQLDKCGTHLTLRQSKQKSIHGDLAIWGDPVTAERVEFGWDRSKFARGWHSEFSDSSAGNDEERDGFAWKSVS